MGGGHNADGPSRSTAVAGAVDKGDCDELLPTTSPGRYPEAAQEVARDFLRSYLGLTNYTTSMRRAGFTGLDVAHEGSDNLIDRLVVHGDAPFLAARRAGTSEAGADHVCVQVR